VDCQARVRPEGDGSVVSGVSVGGGEVMIAEVFGSTQIQIPANKVTGAVEAICLPVPHN
jgi:hypothetical protein